MTVARIDFGHIELSDRFLLGMLQLSDGELQAVQWNVESRTLLLRIKHPDMPELDVVEGIGIPTTLLTYTTHTCGHVCDLGKHEIVTRDEITKFGVTTEASSK